jgi:ribosomal protein S18 acetylase RimI-like enzyme
MTIRKATVLDVPRIGELYRQSDEFHFRNEPYIYRESTEPARSDEYLAALAAQADGLLLVAEEAGEVVGFSYGYEERRGQLPLHRPRVFFVLDNIAVDGRCRGRGYGEALMRGVIDHAREKAYDDVTLNVYRFNADAIRLYEKMGFTEISRDMILKL